MDRMARENAAKKHFFALLILKGFFNGQDKERIRREIRKGKGF